jgi:hypothetical protein
MLSGERSKTRRKAYNKPLVPDGGWEAAVESNSIVIWVISLIRDDVFKQGSLMPQNLRQATTTVVAQLDR